MYYQQGDILIKKITSLPNDLKSELAKNERFILAEGEATGHNHSIVAEPLIEFYRGHNGRLYLKAEKSCIVTHQEHNEINISPGLYEIDKVQEYDHFLEESRKVID